MIRASAVGGLYLFDPVVDLGDELPNPRVPLHGRPTELDYFYPLRDLILIEGGPFGYTRVVEVLRDLTDPGLEEAIHLVNTTPAPVLVAVLPGIAEWAAARLQKTGGSVQILNSGPAKINSPR